MRISRQIKVQLGVYTPLTCEKEGYVSLRMFKCLNWVEGIFEVDNMNFWRNVGLIICLWDEDCFVWSRFSCLYATTYIFYRSNQFYNIFIKVFVSILLAIVASLTYKLYLTLVFIWKHFLTIEKWLRYKTISITNCFSQKNWSHLIPILF